MAEQEDLVSSVSTISTCICGDLVASISSLSTGVSDLEEPDEGIERTVRHRIRTYQPNGSDDNTVEILTACLGHMRHAIAWQESPY
jgi:hypothetical protein